MDVRVTFDDARVGDLVGIARPVSLARRSRDWEFTMVGTGFER